MNIDAVSSDSVNVSQVFNTKSSFKLKLSVFLPLMNVSFTNGDLNNSLRKANAAAYQSGKCHNHFQTMWSLVFYSGKRIFMGGKHSGCLQIFQ